MAAETSGGNLDKKDLIRAKGNSETMQMESLKLGTNIETVQQRSTVKENVHMNFSETEEAFNDAVHKMDSNEDR